MRFTKKRTLRLAVSLAIAAVAAFAAQVSWAGPLRLSTTTSTDNTGLLEHILPAYEKVTGQSVDVVAVGTGKALKLAENGDVDVTLVHAPALEEKFVADGFGVNRRLVMANYFIIVGPPNDPAAVATAKNAPDAFRKIANGRHPFVSRGDNSGTHVKEKEIWKAAGVATTGSWYIESGRGMGETLTMADEKRGYTLSDDGTFIQYGSKVDLKGLFAREDQVLYNPYSVIAVNPERWKTADYAGATKFIDWLCSAKTQAMIGEFTSPDGRVLFTPLAKPGI